MSEGKKNHHFVPQGLLKNWYSEHTGSKNKGFRKYQRNYSGKIELNKNICSTKSTCSEDDLNTTYNNLFELNEEYSVDTNTIENKLAYLDNLGIEIIQKILLEKSFDNLNSDELVQFSKFIVSIHMRHPDTINSVIKETEEKGAKFIEIIKENLECMEHHDQLDLMQRNLSLNAMIDTIDNPETYQYIKNMNWFLVEAKGIEFFTGERPLVANFCENQKVLKFGFGISLSPSMLMIGINKELYKNKIEEINNFIQNFVAEYNARICLQSKYIVTTRELSKENFEIFVKNNLAPL